MPTILRARRARLREKKVGYPCRSSARCAFVIAPGRRHDGRGEACRHVISSDGASPQRERQGYPMIPADAHVRRCDQVSTAPSSTKPCAACALHLGSTTSTAAAAPGGPRRAARTRRSATARRTDSRTRTSARPAAPLAPRAPPPPRAATPPDHVARHRRSPGSCQFPVESA